MTATTQTSAKRRNAILAAIAGATLLIGGSTYALWSVTDNFGTASIAAGNFNLVAGTSNAWDVSTDLVATETAVVTDTAVTLDGLSGVAIADLSAFQTVPGDTLALTFPFDVTVSGDNLVAALQISGTDTLGASGTFAAATDGTLENIHLSYQLFDSTGAPVPGYETPLALGATDTVVSYFASTVPVSINVPLTSGVPVVDSSAGQQAVTLVVYAAFDPTTANTDDTTAALTLSDALTVTLEQVRTV